MDLLSVLNQRHIEQSSETLSARTQFWRSLFTAAGFLCIAVYASPVNQVSRQGTFLGTFLSLVFLLGMAGAYASVMQSLHSLSTLRLPTSYADLGLSTQIRLFLPGDIAGTRQVGGSTGEKGTWFDCYGFYFSFISCVIFGFVYPVFFLFAVSLLVFCVSVVRHSVLLYV